MAEKKGFSLLSGFVMDLRSLALFRITFGICLVLDVTYRMFYVNDFYTDIGVMPRDALITQFLNIWESSLFLINGQAPIVLALMTILVAAAVSFTLGFYTRVSAFVCWVLMISLHARNQAVLHGGDDVFRCLLFWCQFAPLGAEFSLDRFLNPSFKPAKPTVLSFGAAGLMMQLLFIYIFTALLKWDRVWWTEGTAVYYALSLDEFTSSLGSWLLNFPFLMRMATYSTVLLELLGPLSVIAPFYFLRFRMFFAFSFILFHFGLSLTMVLGLFPWVCMSAWLMVLPSAFWDKAGIPSLHWMKRLADKIKRRGYQGLVPRVHFGRINEAIALVFLILVFVWNVSQLDFIKFDRPQPLRQVMHIAEIYQRWSMFAPYPRRDDGWYVIDAKLNNGEHVDPWRHGAPVSYEKPQDVAGTYRNSIWRKYLTNLWLKSYSRYRLYFGRYLCRVWNSEQSTHATKIDTMHIFYMMEMTPEPGQPPIAVDKQVTWRHYCFDKPADWVD